MIKINKLISFIFNFIFSIKINAKIVLISSVICSTLLSAQTKDSTASYTTRYPFIHSEFAFIQFYNKSTIDQFVKSWENTKNSKMSIVHLGDSHLQSDYFPGRVRNNLHTIHGDGGRGIMFPYSAAKTYSSFEYKSRHTGEWTYAKSLAVPPKIPLGVSGMTCKTEDSNASFTFTFINDVPSNYSRLKLFCKKDSCSYDLIIVCGDKEIPINIAPIKNDSLSYYEINLPAFKNEIVFKIKKNKESQTEFTFYGISLETSENNGIIYHNCGVGGAKYESIIYEKLFAKQLPALNPNLVIIDFGTNDYLYDDSLKANEEEIITKVIKLVRAAAPNASIILTSTMDMYYKSEHIKSGEAFSDLIKKIAKEKNCGLFDWYWVAGGWDVMPKFQEQKLANPDGVHMSPSGYRLKANLLSLAMSNTISLMNKNPKMDSLVIKIDSLKFVQQILKLTEKTDSTKTGGTIKVMHKIKQGENLSVIAKKYHVTVVQLRSWNHLKSNLINAGKYLVVYCNPKYIKKNKLK